MTEYALAAFGILALSGVLSLLSYGSGRAEKAALADSIAIEKYLDSLSLGDCEVEIEIG